MLDHVQVPDLALLEVNRILRPDGRLLIGLYVEGGKNGIVSLKKQIKNKIKYGMEFLGSDRFVDHHLWHPSYDNLLKLIEDNRFTVTDTYWQPCWDDTVCYVCARKAGS